MAEGGPSNQFRFNFPNPNNPMNRRGNRGGNRKSQNNCQQDDEANAPKIIFQKRPPRRPKLPNGTEAPCVSMSQVIESSEHFAGNFDNGTIQKVENSKNIVQSDRAIQEIAENVVALKLSRDSSGVNTPKSTPSTPEKCIIDKSKKRVRRPRKRNKSKENIDEHDNMEFNSTGALNVSNVSNLPEIERKKEKHLLVTKGRNKVIKSIRSTSNDSNLQETPDKQGGASNDQKNRRRDKRKKEKRVFCEHLPAEVVREIIAAQDPACPNIIEGNIRINPRCYQNAYVSLATGEQDVLIIGLKDRNRALEGDLVAVIINSRNKWLKLSDNLYQKTGYVVSILEKFHPRKAVGYLKKQDVFVILQPRDYRIPILKINPKTVPKNFYDNPDLYKETLFLCDIVDWNKVAFADGEIVQIIGSKGDLSVETNAILLENDLILTPYEDELLQGLPSADYIPTETDIADREDLRKSCIFTIDPATAVDLDDALSCRPLENGNFEVGVHIADVTHFLEAFSSLDRKVAERATTVYMVDNVYHMLPKQLCMACSLLPGKDKLAFSVIIEMTANAEIVNYRFAKTVINSCCQMSYEQAQIMIDNKDYDWKEDGTLKISGDYEPKDLCKVVRNLYSLSTQIRDRRFDEGALRIDQPKLIVFLDGDTRLPCSYKLEERKESNSLIEEFMLLANMTVAKHLYETLPGVSLLRSHAEPSMRILQKTRDLLTKFGVLLNVESAGSLHNSLLMYQPDGEEEQNESNIVAQYRMMVINSLCAKSMTRAVYKCSASAKTKDNLRHYALNAEFYTHFTSPIRRYPDCVVHRLLFASIKNHPLPEEWSSSLCAKVATNCNTKKYSAKMAQEQSSALYFTYMLDLRGSMNTFAIVMDVKERSADAMLCDTGLKVRLYFSDTFEETLSEFTLEHDVPTVKLTWKQRQIVQVINIFSILHVKITKHPQLFKLQGIILPPVTEQQI